jgi:hypothetical protein
MPLTPPLVTGALLASLPASGFIGISVPQLAAAIGAGVGLWVSSALQVVTVDVGTLGVGVGILPCVVPPALLTASMLTTFPATGHLGPFAPALANGVALGLSIAFPSGLITTSHPTVGLGACVATFVGTAVPSMVAGFAAQGLAGPSGVLTATAVGAGLDITFNVLKLPIPIVGPPNIVPSGGVGFGKLL